MTRGELVAISTGAIIAASGCFALGVDTGLLCGETKLREAAIANRELLLRDERVIDLAMWCANRQLEELDPGAPVLRAGIVRPR